MEKETQQAQSVLGEMKPSKAIIKLAVPATLALLAKAVYNIVDTAYIGMLHDDNALAAVGASSSVQFLVLGFCIGACAGFGIPLSFDRFSGYTVYAVIQSGSRNAACGGRQ